MEVVMYEVLGIHWIPSDYGLAAQAGRLSPQEGDLLRADPDCLVGRKRIAKPRPESTSKDQRIKERQGGIRL